MPQPTTLNFYICQADGALPASPTRCPMLVVGGTPMQPYVAPGKSSSTFIHGGKQRVWSSLGALQVSGNYQGIMHPSKVPYLLCGLYGLPTTTGAGPYVHTWSSTTITAGAAKWLAAQDCQSAAANESYLYRLLKLTSFHVSGKRDDLLNLNCGIMATQDKYKNAQPSFAYGDDDDYFVCNSTGSQKVVASFTPDGGSLLDLAAKADTFDVGADRAGTVPPASLTGANPALIHAFEVPCIANFHYNHGYADPDSPDIVAQAIAMGAATGVEPDTYGLGCLGAFEFKCYGGLISGSDYYHIKFTGNGRLAADAWDASNSGQVRVEATEVFSIEIQNNTATYTVPSS